MFELERQGRFLPSFQKASQSQLRSRMELYFLINLKGLKSAETLVQLQFKRAI